jgi:hypothetical protein
MIRIVTTLFAVFVAVSAFADSYHPHILKSHVVSLDVATIERHARSGTPFKLDLGAVSLEVSLSPAPVWPEEGLTVITVAKDGSMKESVVHGNITYAGEVEGEDPKESEARFTIAEGVLEGYVLSKTGSWFLEPLSRFHPKADGGQYLVYATRDLDFVLDFGDDGLNEEIDDPTAPANDPNWQIPSNLTSWQIPVVMTADRDYYLASETSFATRHASLINMINGIYRPQTGRQFVMRISVGDTDGAFLTSTDAYVLRRQLRWYIAHVGGATGPVQAQPYEGLRNLNSYFAHLTTGKELTNDLVYGLAEDGGRFALSRQVVLPFSNGTVLLNVQRKMLAAHEIGHNFGGAHAAAEEICVDEDLWWCADYQRTLMWRVYECDTQPRFSDGTRDPNKNNRKNVQDFMTRWGFTLP